MKKKISVGTWCFQFPPYDKKPVGLDDVCEKLAALGYDGISLDGNHANPTKYPTKESRKELAKRITSYGLGVSEFNPAFGVVEGIVIQDNPSYWLSEVKENLEFISDLDLTENLRVDTRALPTYVNDENYQRAWDTTVTAFRKASEMAQSYGKKLVWEFEPGFVFNTPDEIIDLYNEVDHPAFTLECDSAHVYTIAEKGLYQVYKKQTLPGGQTEFYKMLENKVGLVHIIDNDGTLWNGVTSMHVQFGEGDLDFDNVVFPGLRDHAKYKGDWWVVDLVFNDDAWNILEEAKKKIDVYNAKYGDY